MWGWGDERGVVCIKLCLVQVMLCGVHDRMCRVASVSVIRRLPKDDDLIRFLAQLALDESQQVLLVHAGAVMHVGVDFAHVVEIAMGGL